MQLLTRGTFFLTKVDEYVSSKQCKLACDRVRTRNDSYCNFSTPNKMVIVDFVDI